MPNTTKPSRSVKAAVVKPMVAVVAKPQVARKSVSDIIAAKFQAAGKTAADSVFKSVPMGTSARSMGRAAGRAFGSIGRAMRSMPSGRMGRSMRSTYGAKKKGSAY